MRESRTLEYKENLSSNTFLKTISAYANYGEGKIIFGINDQGNIIGITDPVNGCLNLENKIKELDQEIVRNATDYPKLNALTKEKEETEEKLMEKMERWEYLTELAEKIEAQKS